MIHTQRKQSDANEHCDRRSIDGRGAGSFRSHHQARGRRTGTEGTGAASEARTAPEVPGQAQVGRRS